MPIYFGAYFFVDSSEELIRTTCCFDLLGQANLKLDYQDLVIHQGLIDILKSFMNSFGSKLLFINSIFLISSATLLRT